MTTLPTFITRLLDHLGQSHLAGDLAEEFHKGRSSTWVWWQLSAAVVRGVITAVGLHPYLTFRAIALGWITVAVLNGHLPLSPHPEVGMWIRQSPAWVMLIGAQYFIAGWVVARLSPRCRTAMVLGATVFLTLINGITVVTQFYFILRFGEYNRIEMSPMTALSLATSFCLPLITLVGGLSSSIRRPRATTAH